MKGISKDVSRDSFHGSKIVIHNKFPFHDCFSLSLYCIINYHYFKSRCAALEVAEMGIHINCIGPGPIDTPMMTKLEKQALGENVSKEEAMKIFAASYPDKRYCRPEEVADLALFLASDKSSHITGSLVTMDGGQAALGR